jgi:hypothetical protein
MNSAQTEPVGGQPVPGAKSSVRDLEAQVGYQRAFEAVIWAVPAASIYRFREGALKAYGIADNDIVAFSKPATAKAELLTANNVTPYITAFTDLRTGPVVLEVPAKTDKAVLYGQIVDAWQVTIADVGPSGDDKGAGGKYLLIPPGYKNPLPQGYITIQAQSYRIALAFRSIPLPGATDADAYAYSQTLKMYPLADAANPKPTRFVDGSSKRWPTSPYAHSGAIPSEATKPHAWRTRVDPFAEVWPKIEALLKQDAGLQAKTVWAELNERHAGRFSAGQLRTLQRRFLAWRLKSGADCEVFFPQTHVPGEQGQSDFTDMRELEVVIAGERVRGDA